jgi:transcriptional regulator with XRE-family HTH domain
MSTQDIHKLIKTLGEKIRLARRENQIPLRELSNKTQLSIGALSQIERGILTPSLSSMMFIARALDRPMGHFFDHAELDLSNNQKAFFLKHSEEKLLHTSKKVTVYLLYYSESANIEVVKNVFEESATTGDMKYQHEGDEWGMVLNGRLKVELENEVYILGKGDSIHFKSNIPHRLVNIHKGRTTQVWLNSPPLWMNTGRLTLKPQKYF